MHRATETTPELSALKSVIMPGSVGFYSGHRLMLRKTEPTKLSELCQFHQINIPADFGFGDPPESDSDVLFYTSKSKYYASFNQSVIYSGYGYYYSGIHGCGTRSYGGFLGLKHTTMSMKSEDMEQLTVVVPILNIKTYSAVEFPIYTYTPHGKEEKTPFELGYYSFHPGKCTDFVPFILHRGPAGKWTIYPVEKCFKTCFSVEKQIEDHIKLMGFNTYDPPTSSCLVQ